MRKHVTRALITFWKFLSRKIIEYFNTTVSINTVNLFIHCTISIVYIIIMFTSFEFQNLGGPICMKPCILYQKCTAEK